MIKVLEITGEPIGTGGQEMFIINVVRHINLTGFEIDWLTPYYCENELYRHDIIEKGGKIYSLNLPFNPGKSRTNIVIPLYKFLKTHQYDVVHIHSGSLSALALCSFVSRITRVKKIIVHSHSTGFKKSARYHLLKFFFYPLIRFMPTCFCACSQIAGKWKYPRSISDRKLIILKNGIDLDAFSPNIAKRNLIRSKYNLSESTILIGHVGRFSLVKNHVFLVDMMDYIRRKSYNCKIVLVGDGELFEEIKRMVNQRLLDDYFIFVGTTSNINDYMQAMDVFVLPSKWEGLPIVMIEAQGAGLPVLVSDRVSPDAKLVEDVKYLPIDDVEIWVKEIMNIRRHKCYNRVIIEKAGYDINDTAEEIRNLYIS